MTRRVFWSRLWAALFAVMVVSTAVWACDTPVYRYAMYRWYPDPYPVLYFYENEPDEADKAVNEKLNTIGTPGPDGANLYFQALNLAEESIDQFSEDLQKEIEAHRGKPFHVILNPWGEPMYTGRLQEADVDALVDSPMRRKLASLLDEGNGVVLLVVHGKDATANESAEKVVRDAIEQMTAMQDQMNREYAEYQRKIREEYAKAAKEQEGEQDGDDAADEGESKASSADEAGSSDESTANETEEAASEEEDTYPDSAYLPTDLAVLPLKATVVSLDPDDKNETWLLRMLSHLRNPESDPDAPAVYAVFGRGRTLPALVGDEINPDNMLAVLDFLAGACSCTVKAQNPGCELVFRWNWDETAEKIAATDPSLMADPYEYSPDLGMIPQLSEPLSPEDTAAGTDSDTGDVTEQTGETVEATTVAVTSADVAAEAEVDGTAGQVPTGGDVEGLAISGAGTTGAATVPIDPAETPAGRQQIIMRYGMILGVVVLIVIGGSIFSLVVGGRRRHD
ncbi:hypothetical protein JCM19992_28620 [Thermostilla marina]